MTDRLYYHAPYLAGFDATVTRVDALDGRTAVCLDRTAFYPTSGGQPFDTGTLGSVRVVEVFEAEDGDLLHVVDGPLAAGDAVHGAIDWTRRFDHMQQHTGQHLLSAAFDRLLGARTESFHLGDATSTIDLAREVTRQEIARVEADANRVVWEDRPVSITFVDAKEAAALPLRKPADREGTLRLIGVEDYDLSACGGTHVARTGGIGIIAVTGWERFKGGSRVAFACGGRALREHARLRDVAAAGSRVLSVGADELPAAIERLQAEARDGRRALKDLQAQLAGYEAAALAQAAQDGRVVAAVAGWDQNGLKSLATAIAARDGYVAALVTTSAPVAVVVARGREASTDCAAVLKQAIERFGGKGGGRADLAQGGGLTGNPVAIVAYLRELL